MGNQAQPTLHPTDFLPAHSCTPPASTLLRRPRPDVLSHLRSSVSPSGSCRSASKWPGAGGWGLPTGHATLRPQRATPQGWPGLRRPTRVPPLPPALLVPDPTSSPDAWLSPSSGSNCPRLLLAPEVATAAGDSLDTRQLTGKSRGKHSVSSTGLSPDSCGEAGD